MHKPAVTSRYIGKSLEKLHSTDSTNARLWALANATLQEGYVLMADYQSQGRGQAGASWFSDEGENLLLSVYLQPSFQPAQHHFQLNMALCLGVADFCRMYLGEGVKVKWPNDIYYHNRKLAGLLIENSLQGGQISETVVGIGININQGYFPSSIPNPTSFQLITGKYYRLNDLLDPLFGSLERRYEQLRNRQSAVLIADYHQQLLGRDESRRYQLHGRELQAILRGVDADGRLLLDGPDGRLVMNHKEIQFRFV